MSNPKFKYTCQCTNCGAQYSTGDKDRKNFLRKDYCEPCELNYRFKVNCDMRDATEDAERFESYSDPGYSSNDYYRDSGDLRYSGHADNL